MTYMYCKAPSCPLRRSCCASAETPTSWRAEIPLAAARRGHSSGTKGILASYTTYIRYSPDLSNRNITFPCSVAGIATCSRAATCWTTRWCTRPTGSSPSTASPSSARHSATSTPASLLLSQTNLCGNNDRIQKISFRSVPAVLHVPRLLPAVLLQAARGLLRPPGDPLALRPL